MDTRFESLLCSLILYLSTFYEEGGYYIYFDESGKDVLSHKLDQGIDMGVLLYLNNFIVGLKYDNAAIKLDI